jgi:hypothetical protein
VYHRKPNTGEGLPGFCKRFGACVMCVLLTGEILMLNNDEQLPNATPAPADRQHDAHRVIASEWLQRAIRGIKEMHSNEEARREVANRLF